MKYTATAEASLTTPRTGSHGQIIIETTNRSVKSQFGKVFAGSMNGTFDEDATIKIKNNGSLDLVSIYACGGQEASIGNMFDITEPLPPEEKPDDYLVNGTVNISLDNYSTDIYGKGANEVNVELSSRYRTDYLNLNEINSVDIKKGTFAPIKITWKNNNTGGDVTLSSLDSHLDLSKIKELNINNFNGGGILTLQRDGQVTIHGEITGETQFQTVGGAVDNSYSGTAEPGWPYIINKLNSGNNTSFTFIPHVFQKFHSLEQDIDGNWIIQVGDITFPTQISNFEFDKNKITIPYDERNFTQNKYNNSIVTDSDLGSLEDIFYDLPFELSIDGKVIDLYQPLDPDNDNNYFSDLTWVVEDLNVVFFITTDTIPPILALAPYIPPDGITTIPNLIPGNYEIKLSIPDYGVIDSFMLNVVSNTVSKPDTILDISVSNNNVQFGDQITVTANSSIQTFAAQNEYDFVINDQFVTSTSNHSIHLDVNSNLFKAGENTLKVIYGGSDNAASATATTTITVNKIIPTLNFLDDHVTVTYDGKKHTLATVVNSIGNVQTADPTIYYYTDPNYLTDETTTPPINAGTYYVKAILPETEIYHGAETFGTLEIIKSKPNLLLSGTIINNDDITNDLNVNLSLSFPNGGTAPTGEIKFEYIDANNLTQTINKPIAYGSVNHLFKDVTPGTFTITATYKPATNEPNYNASQSVTESFEIINDFIPVQDIELLTSELQFYVATDGQTYKSTSTIQLPFTITPDNASNHSVIWETSDPSIVTINSVTGELEMHQPGQAIVTVRTKDGNFSQSCQVTVVELTPDIKPVESISLDSSSTVLALNHNTTYQLKATLNPQAPTCPDIIWKSKNNSVATVDDTGKITAKSVGKTQITAITKDGAKVATCNVQVTNNAQSDIKITHITLQDQTLEEGTKKQLNPIILPAHATNKTLKWLSSDTTIVEVTEDDTIIAHSPGTVTITAAALDGSNITTKCTVTVTSTDSGNNTPDNDNSDDNISGDDQPDNEDSDDNISGDDQPDNEDSDDNISGDNQPDNEDSENNIPDNEQPDNDNSSDNIGNDSNNGSLSGGSSDSNNSGSSNNSNSNSGNNSNNPINTTPDNTTSEQQPTTTIEQFKDATNHWTANAIQFVIDKGLFNGMSENHFGVNTPTSRGMFVTVLHRLAGTPKLGNANFSDIQQGKYYTDAVSWASSLGIVSGVNETLFAPNQNITREQLIVMLYRYAKATGITFTASSTHTNKFQDAHLVSNWAKESIHWAVQTGLLQGNTKNELSPKSPATRAEVATLLTRFIKLTEA